MFCEGYSGKFLSASHFFKNAWEIQNVLALEENVKSVHKYCSTAISRADLYLSKKYETALFIKMLNVAICHISVALNINFEIVIDLMLHNIL